MYTESLRHLKRATSIVLLASFLTFIMGPIPTARAASLTGLSDTMSSLKVSTLSDHEIVFTTPTGATIGQTITLTFAAGFNLGSVEAGDIDVLDDGGVIATTDSVSGNIVTITTTTVIAAGSVVTVRIGENATAGNAQITNPATPGSHTITIAGTFTDTGVITVTILTDDQVAVTADVGQSVTFSISNASITFGTLSASVARYADITTGSGTEVVAHTLAAGTNASGGYTITVSGPTLTAANGTDTITAIPGPGAAYATGTEQFGLKLAASGGIGAVSAPYTNFAYEGAAGADVIATAAGSSATTTYSASYLASISAQTEAGNYSTALTYVATANF